MKVNELAFEDWKKEYEKIILSQKYAKASTLIGQFFASPTMDNLKLAFGAIQDYITAIPLPMETNDITRKTFINRLDEIGIIIFGSDGKVVDEICKKYNIIRSKARVGMNIATTIQNLPDLGRILRNILIDAGEYTTSKGLRVTLFQKKNIGIKRILEEEGFEDLGEE